MNNKFNGFKTYAITIPYTNAMDNDITLLKVTVKTPPKLLINLYEIIARIIVVTNAITKSLYLFSFKNTIPPPSIDLFPFFIISNILTNPTIYLHNYLINFNPPINSYTIKKVAIATLFMLPFLLLMPFYLIL